LPKLHKLPCSCGLSIPVEPHQAGRSIECLCGQQLQVPSLSGILNLELIPEQDIPKKEKINPPKSPVSRSIRTKQVVTVIGAIATVITILLFIFGALVYPRPYWTSSYVPQWMSRYPKLHDVCIMQRHYLHDGKVIGRDSLPISPRDFRLLVDDRILPRQFGYLIWSEEVINQFPDLAYRPIFLIEMHDNFKSGLELSFHFYEKYDKLVFNYWARFVVLSILTIVSLIVLVVGIFLPQQVEEIGERGGESWE
jgi:hypothetical protein